MTAVPEQLRDRSLAEVERWWQQGRISDHDFDAYIEGWNATPGRLHRYVGGRLVPLDDERPSYASPEEAAVAGDADMWRRIAFGDFEETEVVPWW